MVQKIAPNTAVSFYSSSDTICIINNDGSITLYSTDLNSYKTGVIYGTISYIII